MRRFHDFTLLFGNRHGLGAPVGNLIILMAAVILSTTVVLFATNVTTSQVQKEKMYITTSHVWYVNSSVSIVAVGICDTGPTDIIISQLNVKGLQCEWNGTTNYVLYNKTNGALPGDLPFPEELINWLDVNVTKASAFNASIGGANYSFVEANEGLTIRSGQSIAFYAVIPDRVMVYDLSTPLRMVILTTQGVYCTETLVQTA